VRAAGGVSCRRELSARSAITAVRSVDRSGVLTKRRVVDLGRTASMMCQAWMPGR
jgi:hypothetical protein